MNCIRLASLVVLAATLSGCASGIPVVDFYAASSKSLHQYRNIEVLETDSPYSDSFVELEQIQGLFCRKFQQQVSIHDENATQQAIDQVKLKAAEIGADAISAPQCEVDSSSSFSNNCYGSVICTATALQRETASTP